MRFRYFRIRCCNLSFEGVDLDKDFPLDSLLNKCKNSFCVFFLFFFLVRGNNVATDHTAILND